MGRSVKIFLLSSPGDITIRFKVNGVEGDGLAGTLAGTLTVRVSDGTRTGARTGTRTRGGTPGGWTDKWMATGTDRVDGQVGGQVAEERTPSRRTRSWDSTSGSSKMTLWDVVVGEPAPG